MASPSYVRSIAVGLTGIAAAALVRILLQQFVDGVVPFILTFPAVIAATLIAGAEAGAVALIGCQLLTLRYVLPHWTNGGRHPEEITNLVLATISLVLAVWATSSYRRLSRLLRAQCEREVGNLSLLINEMDHRTKNNFQIAASLLSTQAIAASDALVKEQLSVAANRLVSIASVYRNLSRTRPDAGELPLLCHLRDICASLREGLLPDGITLDIDGEELSIKASTALTIGLVVNEWITNAAKYAFPTGTGRIAVTVARSADEVRIKVRDDGIGIDHVTAAGAGSRLMATLVGALNGTTLIRSKNGTSCLLTVPL